MSSQYRDVPIGIKVIQKVTEKCCAATHFNRNLWYRTSVWILTFLAYMSYHATRKTVSVVKTTLNRNCSELVPPADVNSTTDPDWCDWAPFDGPDASSLLGTLDSSFLFAYASAMFISGIVAERASLRYFLALGMIFSGIACYLLGITKTYGIHSLLYFILVQIFGGIVQTTGWPGVVAVMGNWFEKEKRGLIFGIWNSHTSIGNIVGTIIASYYLEKDWSLSFIMPGLMIAIVGFLNFLFLVTNPADVGCTQPNRPSQRDKSKKKSKRKQKYNSTVNITSVNKAGVGNNISGVGNHLNHPALTANINGGGGSCENNAGSVPLTVTSSSSTTTTSSSSCINTTAAAAAIAKIQVPLLANNANANGIHSPQPIRTTVTERFSSNAGRYNNSNPSVSGGYRRVVPPSLTTDFNETIQDYDDDDEDLDNSSSDSQLLPHEDSKRNGNEGHPILADAVPEKAVGFLGALRIPGVMEFSMCLFFAKLVSYTFLYWLPLYIKASTPLTATLSADLSTLFDVGGIIGGIAAGMISDYSGMSATTCTGMLLLAVPVLFIYHLYGAGNLILNTSLLLLTGILVNGPYALITTAVSAELGTHHSLAGNSKALATVTAIIDGTGSIGAAVGPLLAGFVSGASWQYVFYMLMLSDLLALLFLTRLVTHEIKRWRSPAYPTWSP